MSWKRWLVITAAAGVLAAVGGPYVYINFIRTEAAAPLGLSAEGKTVGGGTSPGVTDAAADGTWSVASGSQVGYRVDEVLFGQGATAVGRTDDVSGALEVTGTTIRNATFTVDMTTVQSDQSRRDNQFHGRIMDTSSYPTATFELSEPISFATVPAEGSDVTRTVEGKLTLRGTTKKVAIELAGRRSGEEIRVSGSAPITFAEWNIPNPSFGPVTTEDHGVLEFSLNFTQS